MKLVVHLLLSQLVMQLQKAGTGWINFSETKKCKTNLRFKFVDPSIPRFIIVGPIQISDLLAVTQATSSDYASVKALVNGEIDTFMGFKFVVSNRLSKTGNLRKV